MKEKQAFENIKTHVEMCATKRMRSHAAADEREHPIDFQVFRFLTGYDEALEEIARLKAAIERKDDAILNALVIDAKDGYSMHPKAIKILMDARRPITKEVER